LTTPTIRYVCACFLPSGASRNGSDLGLLGFQGIWKPRKIANPAYFEDLQPHKMTPFNAVGLELWSMTSDIFFDNFFISNDRITADRWATDGWGLKKAAEGAAEVGPRFWIKPSRLGLS